MHVLHLFLGAVFVIFMNTATCYIRLITDMNAIYMFSFQMKWLSLFIFQYMNCKPNHSTCQQDDALRYT